MHIDLKNDDAKKPAKYESRKMIKNWGVRAEVNKIKLMVDTV